MDGVLTFHEAKKVQGVQDQIGHNEEYFGKVGLVAIGGLGYRHLVDLVTAVVGVGLSMWTKQEV